MEYVLRATSHLLKKERGSQALWDQAVDGASGGLEIALRIALVSLHLQLELFRDAIGRGGWSAMNVLSLEEIEADPVGACMIAARALDLEIGREDVERAAGDRAGIYAKDPSRSYSREARRCENEQIERAYGRLFDRAHEWATLAGLTIEPASIISAAAAEAGRRWGCC
jgi:hypothetical protein